MANFSSSKKDLESLSLASFEKAELGNGFIRPLFEDFCFSSLPGLVESSLLGSTSRSTFPSALCQHLGQADHVIFIFIDAFGWESLQRFRDQSNFLRSADKNGLVLKTTSQFPSTTAAHVTTMASGLPSYEHEICGWDYFEPKVGRMIKPLKFSFSEDGKPGTLSLAGFKAEQVLPEGNFYSNLLNNQVQVRAHGPKAYFPSTFGNRYLAPELHFGYSSLEGGLENLLNNLANTKGKSYDYLYTDLYDVVCHSQAPFSPEADTVAMRILTALEAIINADLPSNTLIMVSADHGQIAAKPECDLAVNDLIPGITNYLKTDSRGVPIRFSGGKRALMLHCRVDAEAALLAELRSKLAGAAEVLTMDQVQEWGLLGPHSAAVSYRERLGTIAVLPYPGFFTNWIEDPYFENRDTADHGGISKQEMETPLLCFTR